MADSFSWILHRDHPSVGMAKRLVPELSGLEFLRLLRSTDPLDLGHLDFVLEDGDMSDLLWERDGAPGLCSQRFREIVDQHRRERDQFEWLTATITEANGEKHAAALLHFLERPLRNRAPLASNGSEDEYRDQVVPSVMHDELTGRTIVAHPDPYARPFLVSQIIRAGLEEARCTGVDFVAASIQDISGEDGPSHV